MNKSLWMEYKSNSKFPKLSHDIESEVCIIGGGLTGITTAYYLAKLGKKVVVLEKYRIGELTSGNTTGKITSQHGLIYKYLVNSMGVEKAKQYLDANEQAIYNIEEIIREEGIDCDYVKEDAYTFTQNDSELNDIKDEVQIVQRLGLDAQYCNDNDIPLMLNKNFYNDNINSNEEDYFLGKPILGAIKFSNQASFNPIKYLNALVKIIVDMGVEVYEDTTVVDVNKNGKELIVETFDNKVNSKYVVLASHYPIINNPGFYFMKMYQSISYAIAVESESDFFDGMYISNTNPAISFRTAIYENKKVLIIVGMDNKTGDNTDYMEKYNKLENIAQKMYPDCKVLFRWNTEDCITLDKVPYIGEFSAMMKNIYVATGFNKWGMTSSNIAANIITDKILGRLNQFEEVFNSKRLQVIKNHEEFSNIVKEATNSIIINKFKKSDEKIESIRNGEGKVIEIGNVKVGVYKNDEGKIYAVKPICTHLKCELIWNNLDKTWDCPCHGSRFDYKGKNIYDPAIVNLEVFNIEQ